ncbi:MAG: undecaprenyl-diphosphate phosphatase [Candidatus Pacebacteria bacterium]|nr:undecaprenyl-diphosphate phosphatase [Candidatus Paceibacterota bacterium]
MSPFHALILGLVEGFTEFLPISSTAHLILTAEILGLSQTAFVKTFEIAIQSGAILAVLVIYWRKFLDIGILKKIIAAFIPTAIIGLALHGLAKNYLIGNVSVVLWALGIGGVALILFEKFFKRSTQSIGEVGPTVTQEIQSLSYTKAALIGVAQAVAVIPGVSRSAATIIGGLLAGMSRGAVVEFSFLLAVPTIGAATVLDLAKNANVFTADQSVSLVIGFLAAFVTALVGIKFLLSYVKGRSFVGFGVYRIVVVILFVFLMI